MEDVLEFLKKNNVKLSVRYEEGYDSYLLKLYDNEDPKNSYAYRHVDTEEIDNIYPIILNEMLYDISLDKEERMVY